MTNKLCMVLLLVVGLINFLPVIGLLSIERINAQYGLSINDPNLEILLRHRALLFGLLGGFLIVSVFMPEFQWAAIVLALISMAGFVLLYWSIGDANSALTKIAKADILGLILLALAIALKSYQLRS